ncbi:hypothetical protein F5Y17DRAFT_357726 [Xylariaceae sp. FL0594]|nr:hypothetical protein F5Y17DRAFT_357726 [Xylariaceae sp. FL0594]
MTSRARLDLKRVLISKETGDFKTSLSISSTAFLYNISLENASQSRILSSIASKELWLLPPGSSRCDLHIDLHQPDISPEEASHFIDNLANAICHFSLWSKLGLVVKLLDNGIQYHQGLDSPNIYLSIEQPDMSAALLSPPHAHTAQLKGLESELVFESSARCMGGNSRAQYQGPSWLLWDDATCLVEAALDFTFGIRQHYPTLRTRQLNGNAPSLLDIAPAIWNAYYFESVTSHAKKFPVISSILASTARAKSSELRNSLTALLQNAPQPATKGASHAAQHVPDEPRSAIERRLWELLRTTIKPTIRTAKKIRNGLPPEAGIESRSYNDAGTFINQGGLDRHNTVLQQRLSGQYMESSQDTISHGFQFITRDYDDIPASQRSTGTMADEDDIEQGLALYNQKLHPNTGSIHTPCPSLIEPCPSCDRRDEQANELGIIEGEQTMDMPAAPCETLHPHDGDPSYPIMHHTGPS